MATSKSPTLATGSRGPFAAGCCRLPAHARSACEGHREWIEAQVRQGRNAMAIHRESVDQFGFTRRCNGVWRLCRALRRRVPEPFDRLEFRPGE